MAADRSRCRPGTERIVDSDPAGVISSAPSMLPVLVPMAPSSTITVEDRTEARTRSTSGSNAGDVETDPSLKYNALWGGGKDGFVLAYTPRILFADFTGREHEFEILNGGVAALTILHKRTTFQLNTFDQYGTIFASSLVIPARWKGEGAPGIIYSLPATQGAKLTYVASYSIGHADAGADPTLEPHVQRADGRVRRSGRVVAAAASAGLRARRGRSSSSTARPSTTTSPSPPACTTPRPIRPTRTSRSSSPARRCEQKDVNGNTALRGEPPAQAGHRRLRRAPLPAPLEQEDDHRARRRRRRRVSRTTPTLYQVGPYAGRAGVIPYPTGEFLTIYNPVDPDDRPRNKIQAVVDAKIEPWFSPFGGVNEERIELAAAVNFLFGKNTSASRAASTTCFPRAARASSPATLRGPHRPAAATRRRLIRPALPASTPSPWVSSCGSAS